MTHLRIRFLSALTMALLATQTLAQDAAPAATQSPEPLPSADASMPPTVTASNIIKIPPLPNGMCQLDTSQEADRAAVPDLHLATQGEYKLLAVFAECSNLTALRKKGSQVTFISQYVTVLEQQNPTVALNRQSTIFALSSAIGLTGAYSSQSTSDSKAMVLFGRKKPTYQGIIKQTPDFLIVGTEQRHIIEDRQFGMAAVSLITVIKGEIVTVNFFAPSVDNIYTNLAAQAEAYGTQLLAANP